MNLRSFVRSRTTAVLAGCAVVVLAGGTGAVAAGRINGGSIQNHTITNNKMARNTLTGGSIADGAIDFNRLTVGVRKKINAYHAPRVNPNWGIIDRNVIGNGASTLRTGPTPGVPLGVGSLNMRTGSTTDQAAFGDQTSFVGTPLSTVKNPSYYVYVSGEDLQTSSTNAPSLEFEVFTGGGTSGYSTLVYVPEAGQLSANAWSKVDTSTAKQWYYTGSVGNNSTCNQTTYCTLQQAQQAFPNATLLSVELTKGRDYAFSGDVDDLQVGLGGKNYTFNFEPEGVFVTKS